VRRLSTQQRKIAATLLLICVIGNVDKSMIGLTVQTLQTNEAWSASDAGVVLSVFYISFCAVMVPAGYILDRSGYRCLVLASLSALVVASVMLCIAGFASVGAVFLLIVLARLLAGFGHGGYTNGIPRIIADNFGPDSRGSIQGRVIATAGIGAIITYTVGATLIKSDWRLTYLAIAALFALACLVFDRFVPPRPSGSIGSASDLATPEVRFLEAWTNRPTLLIALMLLLNNLVVAGLLSWLPSMYARVYHVDAAVESVVLVGYAITTVVATGTSAAAVSRWFPGREHVFILICSTSGGALIVLAGLAPTLLVSAIGIYLGNFVIMWAFAAIILLPYRLVPLGMIGSAFSIINIGAAIGGLVQGAMIGRIIDAAGGSYLPAFLTLSVCLVIGGLAPFVLSPRRGEFGGSPPTVSACSARTSSEDSTS
jgi:MFS family permease